MTLFDPKLGHLTWTNNKSATILVKSLALSGNLMGMKGAFRKISLPLCARNCPRRGPVKAPNAHGIPIRHYVGQIENTGGDSL